MRPKLDELDRLGKVAVDLMTLLGGGGMLGLMPVIVHWKLPPTSHWSLVFVNEALMVLLIGLGIPVRLGGGWCLGVIAGLLMCAGASVGLTMAVAGYAPVPVNGWEVAAVIAGGLLCFYARTLVSRAPRAGCGSPDDSDGD